MAGLEFLEVKNPNAKCLVLMLHGYGASQEDLFPLHSYFSRAQDCHWIFPNAPMEVPIGPFFTGRAWFPIDVSTLGVRSLKREEFPEVDESLRLVQDLIQNSGWPKSKIIISGFSQGAMVAVETFLSSSENFLGCGIFSGVYLEQANWDEKAAKKSGQKYFQSHGELDPVLPISEAVRLNEAFKNAKLEGEFVRFQGQHEIPPAAIHGFDRFLNERLRGL